jgi:hypothetical protein
MYEEYAVANKIEVGKTYLWNGIKPSIAVDGSGSTMLFSPVDERLNVFTKAHAELDKLIFEREVLVKEFDKG